MNFKSLSLDSGEVNGTPLQYSCLENPMDGGAWWDAVSGVAQSRTRLSDLAAAAVAAYLDSNISLFIKIRTIKINIFLLMRSKFVFPIA